MPIVEKEEYLKFMIMIKLRYNIGLCKWRLKQREESFDNQFNTLSVDLKYNATLNFCKENIRIAKELFNIDTTDDLNDINNEICKRWPTILEYLKKEKCDYDWTRKDFEDTNNYEIYKYITSYDLYWEQSSSKKDTDPIYFEFNSLRFSDDRFASIFSEIIDYGLFNPNKRTMNGSYQPFWATQFPNDYNPTDISNKVIFDKRCNYRMINNGTDKVLLLLQRLTDFFRPNDLTDSQKNFAVNFLFKIIKENNCSILQEYVDDANVQPDFTLNLPLIFLLFNKDGKLTEYDEINNLYKYCISEEGVINQCNALEHKTEGSSKAIDYYISLLEKDNPENKEGIKLLQKTKAE